MIPPQISTPSKYKTLKYFLVKKMQFDLSWFIYKLYQFYKSRLIDCGS